MFLIFIFDLEYLIRVQSSEPLYAKMNPTSSDHGLGNPVFLLAGAWLYFGLDWGMMEFFTCEPPSKEQLISLSHFWSTVWRKRSRFEHMQTVNRTSRRIRGLFA
jgi:hypothetical protein